MKINVMKKGDRFIGIYGNKIIFETRNKEIRIITLEEDTEGIRINSEKELIIGYGNGTVEYGNLENGIELINF